MRACTCGTGPAGLAAASALLFSQAVLAEEMDYDALGRDILADLVAVPTAPSGGNDTRPAVTALVQRLKAAGFSDNELSVVALEEPLENLIVRYRSDKPRRKPMLMMAHIDVVEALPEDWSYEPFRLTVDDEHYYGRGTIDNKAGAAMLIANLIRLRRESYEPDRDLIVMLTADEESTGASAKWLANERRDLVDAEFALNTDGGHIILDGDEARAFVVQTSEKIYVSFVFEALDPGGHSSLPRSDSPISRLARALVDLEEYDFPVDLNATTKSFFERWQPLAPARDRPLLEALASGRPDAAAVAELPEWPFYNSLARTTCVATQLDGGHAENALPQMARAVVNCRVLPQSSAEATLAALRDIAKPHGVGVSQVAPALPSPPSSLSPRIIDTVTEVARALWPGIPVIPEMSTGATDGLFFRNVGIPVYGVSAIAEVPNENRIHGRDERIRIESFRQAQEFWYRLIKQLSR